MKTRIHVLKQSCFETGIIKHNTMPTSKYSSQKLEKESFGKTTRHWENSVIDLKNLFIMLNPYPDNKR